MPHHTRFLGLPLLGLALLTACDSSTGPEPSALTPDEARAIALAVDNGGTQAVDGQSHDATPALVPAGGASMDRISVTKDFDVSVACPRGGTMAVKGTGAASADDEVGEIIFDLTGTSAPAECAFRTDKELDVELTGDLDFTAHRELRQGEASGSQTSSGSLDYILGDGRTGTCAVHLDTSFSLTAAEATRVIEGDVCGQHVSTNTSWAFTQS